MLHERGVLKSIRNVHLQPGIPFNFKMYCDFYSLSVNVTVYKQVYSSTSEGFSDGTRIPQEAFYFKGTGIFVWVMHFFLPNGN